MGSEGYLTITKVSDVKAHALQTLPQEFIILPLGERVPILFQLASFPTVNGHPVSQVVDELSMGLSFLWDSSDSIVYRIRDLAIICLVERNIAYAMLCPPMRFTDTRDVLEGYKYAWDSIDAGAWIVTNYYVRGFGPDQQYAASLPVGMARIQTVGWMVWT